MISIFLHLLLLAFASITINGYLSFMPLTFMLLWLFVVVTFLLRDLPDYAQNTLALNRSLSYERVQYIWQFSLVLAILLLQAVSDPARLLLPSLIEYFPQTLPILVSVFLYAFLLRLLTPSLRSLLTPYLNERQTQNDFFRARMSFPMLVFPPLLLWIFFEDLTVIIFGNSILNFNLIFIIPLFFISLYALSPHLFNLAWRAKRYENKDFEEKVKEIALKAQTPVSGIKKWDTFNEPVPNAAVAGLFERFRFVYVTEYLAKIFTEEELLAVFAHELAHLRLGHIYSYMIYSLVLIIISIVFKLLMLVYYPLIAILSDWNAVFELLLFALLFIFTFTALARKGEYEADAFASKITCPKDLLSGLLKLQHMKVPTTRELPEFLLTHPTIENRIERLKDKTEDLGQLMTSAKKTRLFMALIALIVLLPATLYINSIWKISKLERLLSEQKYQQAETLYKSLDSGFKEHSLVLSIFAKHFFNTRKWQAALLSAAHAQWGIKLMNYSEVFHHSVAPKIASDFKLMKFVLHSLNFR